MPAAGRTRPLVAGPLLEHGAEEACRACPKQMPRPETLAVLAAAGLVAYAYLGPWFGADFSAPTQEIRTPVILDAE